MLTKGEITALIALLNGMLGGTILVVPLLGMHTGYVLIPIIVTVYGCISGYCTHLLVLHLGKAKSLRKAILEHFHDKRVFVVIYDSVIVLAFLGILINYFLLMVKQIEGFIEPQPAIAICCFVVLVALTLLMRKFDIGDKLLAYGIISIIGYVIFLLWAFITAPSGTK
jgi:hypothetical protein